MKLRTQPVVSSMRTAIALLIVLSTCAAAQTPQVNYDIVYVRQDRFGDQTFTWWPEVFHPARLDAGADLMLLLTAAIWGSAFVAQRLGMESIGPMLYNALRFALGALVILPLALRADRRPQVRPLAPRAALGCSVLAGLVLFAGASLQQIGLLHTSVANAGFITGLYVVLVPLLGLALGQRAHGAVWAGAGLAVGGLYLLSVRGDFTVAAGDWLQLAGALCWAVHVLLIDALAPRTHALRLGDYELVGEGQVTRAA